MRLPINKLFKRASTAGFTMIELLVVIAVIGVLAVAVLSSINPIEQINKGRDTRTRSDAAQLINASDRYFAIQEFYPWNRTSATYTTADTDFDSEFDFDGVTGTPDWAWTDELVSTAEVKAGFANRLDTERVHYVYKAAGSNATVYVCFQPNSQAFQLEAAQKCDATGNQETPTTAGPQTNGFCETVDGTVDPGNWICLP